MYLHMDISILRFLHFIEWIHFSVECGFTKNKEWKIISQHQFCFIFSTARGSIIQLCPKKLKIDNWEMMIRLLRQKMITTHTALTVEVLIHFLRNGLSHARVENVVKWIGFAWHYLCDLLPCKDFSHQLLMSGVKSCA